MQNTAFTAPWPTGTVMRFLTLGGATVELYRHTWTVHHYATTHTPAKTFQQAGFEWRCTGCDKTGAEKHHRMNRAGYDETTPSDSRNDANAHASVCRALPRPDAA
jgi:hypothetical protein